MAATADEINIRFGASIDELKAKLGEVMQLFKGVSDGAQSELASKAASSFGVFGKQAEDVATSMAAKFNEMPAVMRAAGVAVLGLGAAIGVGLAAKKFADDNAAMVEGTRDFARAMGMSTNEASVMRAALDDVGASQGEFEGAAKGLARQIRTNEEAVNKYGLVTRDASGNLRPMNELTLDAIKLLGEYKEGTDRNIASQGLFGRGIDASSRLMLLNRGVVEENRKAVDELSLSVGESAVEGFKDYDAASDRAELTMQAFAKAIQESVLPVATELTEWFNNLAPAAITVLRGALGGLTTAFLGLTNGVRVVWEVINAMVVSVAEPIRALAVAIGKAITGDFSGAAAEIKGIGSTIVGAWDQAFDKIGESSQKTRDRIGRVWAFATGGNDAKGDSGSPEGTRSATVKTPKEKTPKDKPSGAEKVSDAELALHKAEAQALLAEQSEYLKQDQALNEQAYRDHLVSIQEYYDRKLELELLGNQRSLDARRADLEAAKEAERRANEQAAGADTEQERNRALAAALKAQAEEAKLLGQINVLEAQRAELIRRNGVERENAQRKLGEELTMVEAQRIKGGAEGEIAQERANLDAMRQLKQVSAEEAFAMERQIEQREYAATQAFLATKRALIQGDDAKAFAQANAEEEAAERAHQARLTQIDRQASLERRRVGVEASQSVQGSFANMIGNVLNGTQRIGAAFRQFGQAVARTFTDLIARKFTEQLFDATGVGRAIDKMVSFVISGVGKMVSRWVLGQTEQTAATAAGSAQRESIETASSLKSIATSAWTAIKNIGASAWEAAAKVYAAIAAIPIVGPFMAPAMAVAAGALVLGFASRIASSEGGEYRVDDDRLNFVHKDETILPAPFAEGLRTLIDSGNAAAVAVNGQALPKPQAMSDVGRMVVRWQNGDEGAGPERSVAGMMQKMQALQSGEPVGWRLPANRLASIQSPSIEPAGGASGGGSSRQAAGGDIHIHAVDADSVKRLFRNGGRALAATLRDQARNFASTKV